MRTNILVLAFFCTALVTMPTGVAFDCYSLPAPCIHTAGCMSHEVKFAPGHIDPNMERCMPTQRVLVHNVGSGRLECTDAPPWIRRRHVALPPNGFCGSPSAHATGLVLSVCASEH
jgi:hypothetical protein